MPDERDPAPARRLFGRRHPEETRLQRLERIGEAYGLVLVLVMVTFVVSVTLPPQGWFGRVLVIVVTGITAILALTSSDVSIERVRLAVMTASVAVGLSVLARIFKSNKLLGVAFIIDATLLGAAVITVLRRVVLATRVGFRTILGAISVYTMLGLLYAYLFIGLGRLRNHEVFTGVAHAEVRDYMFFSYTTLTTTGYGNLVPAGDVGQILAVFEMLTGQIFLVTLVAGLVSLWRPGGRGGEPVDESP